MQAFPAVPRAPGAGRDQGRDPVSGPTVFRFDRSDLPHLFAALGELEYEVLGPTIREDAIVYDTITDVSDLPVGWRDVQQPGSYRLERRGDEAVFGFNVAQQSWKRELYPPRVTRFTVERDEQGIHFRPAPPPPARRAFLGVRACELAAIGIQDGIFTEGEATDADYRDRRDRALLIAVNCTVAGGTCFCASMNTGPAVGPGADLVLTEILEPGKHWFLLEATSDAGQAIADRMPAKPASMDQIKRARTRVDALSSEMGRTLDTDGLPEALLDNVHHPRWDEVGSRCLGCASCTLVCPTCFCSSTENVTDLGGDEARLDRVWDSCFSDGFSYLGGGPVRATRRSRYRQWLTHKLAHWHTQFDSSGCVGCGRCITWCPVGIDITEEAAAVRTPP